MAENRKVIDWRRFPGESLAQSSFPVRKTTF